MKFSQIMSMVLVACLLVTSVPVSADHEVERYYKLGVQSGTTSDLYIADELPNAVVSGFDTVDLAINALKIGDVDFVLADLPTLKYYETTGNDLYVAGSFGAEDFGIAVAPGESDLLAAIDVALGEIINSGQYDVIFADTFGNEIVVLTDDTTSDTATAYPATPTGTLADVLAAEELVFGTDPYYPPFESYDDDGVVVGFDADMAAAIGGRIATAYDQDLLVIMHEKTWDDLLAFQYTDYDATLSAMTKTAQRAENTDFSRAYYSSKQGILGSDENPIAPPVSVADLNGFVQYAEDDCPFTLDNPDNPCNHSDDNPCSNGNHESGACWDYVNKYCDDYDDDPGCADMGDCPFTLDNADNPCNDSDVNPCADGAGESDACRHYVDDYCAEYDDPGCLDIGGRATFVCGDGNEIDFWFVNDGKEDCADGSDEQQYDEFEDRINWFDCHDGSEVWIEVVNNGVDDCPDGEDEGHGDDCPVDDKEWCRNAEAVCDEESATHDNVACATIMGEYCTENPDDKFCEEINEWCGQDFDSFEPWNARIGVQSGTTSDVYLTDEVPNVVVSGFESIDLAVNALKIGDVDFVLGDLPTLKYYEADADDLYIAGSFGAEDFGIAVAPGESDLLDAIDVALGEIIVSGQYDHIFADTFGDEIVVLTDDTTSDTATAYPATPTGTLADVLAAEELVFGTDPYYPPFESYDSDGVVVGFDADIAWAIGDRIATAYDQDLLVIMHEKTWDDLLAFQYTDYDATLSAMTKTAQRAENTDFSRAYYSSKQGILASEDSPGIEGVEDLKGVFEMAEEDLAFCNAYNDYEPPSEFIVNSEENPDCYQNWMDNGNPVWSQGWTHFASNVTVEWPANSGELWYPEGGGLDPIGGNGAEPGDGHWWACEADVDPSIEDLVEAQDEVPSLTMLVSVLAIGLVAIARRRH